MSKPESNYYQARGFSTYYFANCVFNIVDNPTSYLRAIEDIFGDMRSVDLMKAFPQYTNLHNFIREVLGQIITDDIGDSDRDLHFIKTFMNVYKVVVPDSAWEDEDQFYDFASSSEHYQSALDEIADEVFHVMFNDVGFLQKFNELCSNYIDSSGFGAEFRTQTGTLRRVAIPMWARRAIFHRDKGECRTCKRSLSAMINRLETERYDHIIPLACFGANDVTNIQLLCEPCNLAKSAMKIEVSTRYQRAFKG